MSNLYVYLQAILAIAGTAVIVSVAVFICVHCYRNWRE